MSPTSLWTQYRDELASDPLLVLGLTAALVALAIDAAGVRGPGPARLVQGQAGTGVAAARVLVDRRRHDAGDGHPGDLRGDGAQEPVVRQEPLRVRPEQDVVGAGAGQGVADLREADAAVKQEMERLALERKNLVNNVKKLDESMLALRAVAGTSPAVAQRFPGVLQSLAGVRKSVGLDGPQQLQDFTAPPVDLRAMAASTGTAGPVATVPAAVAAPVPAPAAAPAGEGLSPAQVEGELAERPRAPARHRRHAAAVGTAGRAGPSASRARSTSRRSTPTTSTRRSTAAPRASSSTGSRGWPTPSTTRPATRPTSFSSTSSRWPIRSRPWASTARRSRTSSSWSRSATRGTPRPAARSSTRASTTRRSSRPPTTRNSPRSPWTWPSASPPARSRAPAGTARRWPPAAAPATWRTAEPPSLAGRRDEAGRGGEAGRRRGHARDALRLAAGQGPRGRSQVRRPGCLRLQLPLRRLHGRLQGGRSHLAGLPAALSRRGGGQGGLPEVPRGRQERRRRGEDDRGRRGRRDRRQHQHRAGRRRLPQGEHRGRDQRRDRRRPRPRAYARALAKSLPASVPTLGGGK